MQAKVLEEKKDVLNKLANKLKAQVARVIADNLADVMETSNIVFIKLFDLYINRCATRDLITTLFEKKFCLRSLRICFHLSGNWWHDVASTLQDGCQAAKALWTSTHNGSWSGKERGERDRATVAISCFAITTSALPEDSSSPKKECKNCNTKNFSGVKNRPLQ